MIRTHASLLCRTLLVLGALLLYATNGWAIHAAQVLPGDTFEPGVGFMIQGGVALLVGLGLLLWSRFERADDLGQLFVAMLAALGGGMLAIIGGAALLIGLIIWLASRGRRPRRQARVYFVKSPFAKAIARMVEGLGAVVGCLVRVY